MPTKIEWTNETWNPIVGCRKISDGCKNCYAEKMAARISGIAKKCSCPTISQTKYNLATYKGKWTCEAVYDSSIIDKPMYFVKPRMIFVCSMGDLFYEKVSFNWIDRVLAIMAMNPHHTFQVLTKRPDIMHKYFTGRNVGYLHNYLIKYHGEFTYLWNGEWPLKNLWLGTTVEDQANANNRLFYLLNTESCIHFVSCEPLLGPINLNEINGPFVHFSALKKGKFVNHKLDWVIAGGENGHRARPMHPIWVQGLRDQCIKSKVPFFFKGWGEYAPFNAIKKFSFGEHINCDEKKYKVFHKDGKVTVEKTTWFGEPFTPNGQIMFKVGKKQSGRLLYGKEYSEMPI